MSDEARKKLVKTYVQAYNRFDVEAMLSVLHDEIVFENISDGELTLEIKGIEAFRNQAEQAAKFFAERTQEIEDFVFSDQGCEVNIDYRGIIAADLPNGLKTGDEIKLKGKSIFRFADDKISKIQDIS
ncbi:MAG TPA: nuclear transport factor 2 family protein [Pyrinomonadaceae bacterium]